jgi:hypothetical protein
MNRKTNLQQKNATNISRWLKDARRIRGVFLLHDALGFRTD